jgi:hypothetical protein
MKDILDEVSGISETTFYRVKKEFPELAAAIDESARLEAWRRIGDEEIAFQANEKRLSRAIQECAMDVLEDPRVLQAVVDVVLGKPRLSVIGGESKHVAPRPKDQLQAFRALQDFARSGFLPERTTGFKDLMTIPEPPLPKKEQADVEWLIGSGVSSESDSLTGETGDGDTTEPTVVRNSGDERPVGDGGNEPPCELRQYSPRFARPCRPA